MEIGKVIRRFDRCVSTLDVARAFAFAGEGEGIVVSAEEQTAGRGTKGRSWFSPSEKGLYMTVILRPEAADVSLLPLAAGLAASEAATGASEVAVGLKWPNDVVWKKRKLGGVLGESGTDGDGRRFLLLGIGMNVNHGPEDFPPEIREIATSLKIAGFGSVDKDDLLRRLCAALDKWYTVFKQGRGETIVRAFEKRMIFSPGTRIRLESGGSLIEGTYCGLDASGGLVVESGGLKTIYRSAEIRTVEKP